MFQTKFYNNIDSFPAYNYLKLVEENRPTFLVQKFGMFGFTKKNIETSFEEIQRQIVNKFGISESFREILNINQEILLHKIDNCLENSKANNVFINILTDQLKELTNVGKGDSSQIKTELEKYLGFRLNLKEISVLEYFSYVKSFSEHQNKN